MYIYVYICIYICIYIYIHVYIIYVIYYLLLNNIFIVRKFASLFLQVIYRQRNCCAAVVVKIYQSLPVVHLQIRLLLHSLKLLLVILVTSNKLINYIGVGRPKMIREFVWRFFLS